jgi:5-methylcytosine-specific restriction endonuclease McrA
VNVSVNNREGRLKVKYWHKDPHCYWCARKTQIYFPPNGVSVPSDMATIDHLTSRNMGRHGFRGKTVLSCENCNRARGEMEVAALGGKLDKGRLAKFVVLCAANPNNDEALREWLSYLQEANDRARSRIGRRQQGFVSP